MKNQSINQKLFVTRAASYAELESEARKRASDSSSVQDAVRAQNVTSTHVSQSHALKSDKLPTQLTTGSNGE